MVNSRQLVRKIENFLKKNDLNRVLVAHVIRSVALSMIGVYIPILLLESGQSLSQVIIFYLLVHVSGLLGVFFIVVPLMHRFGAIAVFKLYYPLEIGFFILLNLFVAVGSVHVMWVAAIMAGIGGFAYWVPHNILFLRNTKKDVIGGDLATFFALPKFFSIAGPLIAGIIVVNFGFVPMFVVASVGLIMSYLPLRGIKNDIVSVRLKFFKYSS